MEYPEDYIAAKDIDWFCVINGYYVHVASAGGVLPEVINDRDKLRTLQHNVFMAPDIFTDDDIEVNTQFLNTRFGNKPNSQVQIDNYLASFKAMARKGFISFDRTNLSDTKDNTYHVVCKPIYPIRLQGIGEIVKYSIQGQNILSVTSENVSLIDALAQHLIE